MFTDTALTERKATTMAEWAEVLARGAHDALERMDTTLTLAEVKVALMREMIVQRREESLRGMDTSGA